MVFNFSFCFEFHVECGASCGVAVADIREQLFILTIFLVWNSRAFKNGRLRRSVSGRAVVALVA